MYFRIRKNVNVFLYVFLVALATAGTALAHGIGGGSSSQSAYVVPVQSRVTTQAILTVGDSVNAKPNGSPYRLVGIPDGLGAFDNHDGTFTLLVNHELRDTVGITRAHGAIGAFVSKWTISKNDLSVLHGEDLIQNIATWNLSTSAYNAPATGVVLSRLCSADLPEPDAFYNKHNQLGSNERIFMNGEESGIEGRAFAHLMDGTSYELPRLGKLSWENSVANPSTGNATVVVGLDDGTGGQVYVYVGEKTSSGLAIEKAGLTNGALYGIKVNGFAAEDAATGIPSGSTFTAVDFGDVSAASGASLEASSVASAVTTFQRPEDGAWDPRHPNDFYFVTTASFTGSSRLWRLRFNDPADPAAGGTLDMLLDGSEGPKMMDNLTITKQGEVVIQEDPGNQAHLAKVWQYDIDDDEISLVAQHDPDRFTAGAANFLTQDEESSGIIDASDILGNGWFLLAVQAHYNPGDAELVEGGQLLAMRIK